VFNPPKAAGGKAAILFLSKACKALDGKFLTSSRPNLGNLSSSTPKARKAGLDCPTGAAG
jgi:hypothetical protein